MNVLAVVEGISETTDFRLRGLCAQTDPELFFPEPHHSNRDAKRVCADCPVRSECLEYALTHDERFGIWGGLSAEERRKLRRATTNGPGGTTRVPKETGDMKRPGLRTTDRATVSSTEPRGYSHITA